MEGAEVLLQEHDGYGKQGLFGNPFSILVIPATLLQTITLLLFTRPFLQTAVS